MIIQAAEMLATAGAVDIHPFNHNSPPGLTIHEMGTARMGADPKKFGAECPQSGARREEPFPDRWRVHGFVFVRESFADVYGADGAGLRLCGFANEKRRTLIFIQNRSNLQRIGGEVSKMAHEEAAKPGAGVKFSDPEYRLAVERRFAAAHSGRGHRCREGWENCRDRARERSDTEGATRVIDANGTTLAPGLIDSHVHPVAGDWTPRQNQIGWIDSCLHGGVTTMISAGEVHMPGRPKDVVGVKAMAITAQRAFAAVRPSGVKVWRARR